MELAEDALAAWAGRGPGDDDDEDESGGGSGGNIDPDEDEGYDDGDGDDLDEEPLQCAVRVTARDASLRRSIPWYDARVRRSASF